MPSIITRLVNTAWAAYGALIFPLFFSVWDQPLTREGTLPLPATVAAMVALVPFVIFALVSDLARKGSRSFARPLRDNYLPLLTFAAVAFFALALSLLPGAFWEEGGKWIMLVPYGFAISTLALFAPLQPGIRRLFPVYVFAALCLLFGSMLTDVFYPGTYSSELTRPAGFPGNANFAALVVVMLCAASLDYERSRSSWIDAAFLFLSGVCIALTESRSGLLNFGVLLSYYGYHRFIRNGIRVAEIASITFALSALATVLFLVIPLAAPDFTLFRQESRLAKLLRSERMDDGSAASRYAAVQDSLRLVNEAPLLGHGTGHARTMSELPHNLYLQQWVNNGLPGLLSYLALLGVLYKTFKARRFRPGQAFVLVTAVGSVFSHNILDQRPFLMLLGILLTASTLARRPAAIYPIGAANPASTPLLWERRPALAR